MIQSLPSLHEKHLIAIVRLRKHEGDSRPKEKTVISPGKPVVTQLNSLATCCKMFLKQLPQKKDNAVLTTILSEFAAEAKGRQSMALCSKSDNPFTWLETGCWKEQVLQLKEAHPFTTDVEMYTQLPQSVRATLNRHFGEHCYSQMLILV